MYKIYFYIKKAVKMKYTEEIPIEKIRRLIESKSHEA